MAGRAVRLYNSLTRRIEPLEPIRAREVGIYTCGPTVYQYAHVGNLRSFLFADVFRSTLQYAGYSVRHVKNITDVGHMRNDDDAALPSEDRVEQAALGEGKTPEQIADYYTAAWLEDEALINILPADVMPRASDHIPEMIDLTRRLLDRGVAYEVDGTVYFDVSAFPGYGQLSGQKLDSLRAGHRVQIEGDKRDPADFALWKRAGQDRLMKWPSPWGEGFPGWHIECSAMSLKHLGERFDIHTGGIDNKFPHHEDEIAQSEAALGHRAVSVWMHGEFLTLSDAKMAKSVGNVVRVADLPAMGYEPLAFRYLALTAHYRSKLDFTAAAMHAAASGLARLRRAVSAGADAAGAPADLSDERSAAYRLQFTDAVVDDLALPKALAIAHQVASAADLSEGIRRALLVDFDRVLGLSLDKPDAATPALPEGAGALLERRSAARARGDWTVSDRLRDELAAHGVEVRDKPDGTFEVEMSRRQP